MATILTRAVNYGLIYTMDTQYYAGIENPEDTSQTLRDFYGTREQALEWARVQTREGYTAYVYDPDDRLLDRRLWDDSDPSTW